MQYQQTKNYIKSRLDARVKARNKSDKGWSRGINTLVFTTDPFFSFNIFSVTSSKSQAHQGQDGSINWTLAGT